MPVCCYFTANCHLTNGRVPEEDGLWNRRWRETVGPIMLVRRQFTLNVEISKLRRRKKGRNSMEVNRKISGRQTVRSEKRNEYREVLYRVWDLNIITGSCCPCRSCVFFPCQMNRCRCQKRGSQALEMENSSHQCDVELRRHLVPQRVQLANSTGLLKGP